MNKKIVLSVIIILFLILVSSIIIYFFGGKISSNIAKSQRCIFLIDIRDINFNGDPNQCDCLKDIYQKDMCLVNIKDTSLFTQATKQMDFSLCDGISVLTMKNGCINVVQGKIDFINKSLSATSIK